MAIDRRWWLSTTLTAVAGLALSGFSGCASGSGSWLSPSSWWGGNSSQQSNSLAQQNKPSQPAFAPSQSGASARLGSPPPIETGPFSAVSASFKKWTGTGETKPAAQPDELSLDSQPKQISSELYMQMARMYEAKGDFDGAIKQYEQALKTSPKDTQLLCALGRAYDRKADFSKAMVNYQQAIKIDPRCATAHNDLGLCLARQGDRERSLESLRRAVELAPDSKLYRNNLATVLVDLGRYDEAFTQLSSTLPVAASHYNVGYLAYRRGDKDEAMRRFNLATQIDPNFAPARKMVDKIANVSNQIPSREQVQAKIDNGANQLTNQANQFSGQANTAIRDAEAKLRAALEAKTAPIAPHYGNEWSHTSTQVPAQAVPTRPSGQSIEPPPPELTGGAPKQNLSDDSPSDEMPILLPPTGE